jgi:hypothetical protein
MRNYLIFELAAVLLDNPHRAQIVTIASYQHTTMTQLLRLLERQSQQVGAIPLSTLRRTDFVADMASLVLERAR